MLAPWKKSYDQPRQHIKKQRHYFANKGPVRAMVFPVVMHVQMWELDHKAERQRIDAFELWSWRGLLRVSWTARKSNQSILEVISPEYSLGGLIVKLKLQYFGHLMQRTDSLEKTLVLGKIEGGRRRRWQDEMVGWHPWFNGYKFEQAPGVGEGQGSSTWGHKESDTTEWLNNKNLLFLRYIVRNTLFKLEKK